MLATSSALVTIRYIASKERPIDKNAFDGLKGKYSRDLFNHMSQVKTVKICPQCRGTGLYYEAGLVTGYKYHCKDCDYVGVVVLEMDVPLEEDENEDS